MTQTRLERSADGPAPIVFVGGSSVSRPRLASCRVDENIHIGFVLRLSFHVIGHELTQPAKHARPETRLERSPDGAGSYRICRRELRLPTPIEPFRGSLKRFTLASFGSFRELGVARATHTASLWLRSAVFAWRP